VPSTSFQRAASRIRKLSCPPLARESVTRSRSRLALTERLQSLSMMRTTNPLLPNLCQLSWTDTDQSRYVYIRLFLSPTLESLELDFFFHKPHHFPFFASLPKLCPNLHRMSISKHSVMTMMRDAGPSAIRTISELPRLTTLEFKSSTISEADLIRLSKVKSLTTLSLVVPSWSVHEGLLVSSCDSIAASDSADRSWFCNLRKLQLRAYSVPAVTSFIEPGCGSLQTVVFIVSEAPTTAFLTGCFRTLRSSQDDIQCSAMRHIKVQDSLSSAILGVSQLPESKIITLDVFRPLLAFTKLRALDLGVCLSFSLGDSDIATMASSWPELEVFCLNEGRGWRSTRPSITIHGLEWLCALCPRLYQIALVVNALDTFPPCPINSLHATRQNRAVVRNLAVTHLSLGDSWLAKPHDVACALSNIFPRLKRITAWQPPLDKLPEGQHYRRLWEDVNSLLEQRFSTDRTLVDK
jgi:hypothetical protein